MAFVNGGGIRVSINVGEITLNDILMVHPFGNDTLCMAESTGQQNLDCLEMGACDVPEENGSFKHVSGMSYEIHTYIPSAVTTDKNGMFTGVADEYRVKDVMIGGEPLVLDKMYTPSLITRLSIKSTSITSAAKQSSGRSPALIFPKYEVALP